MPFSLSSLHSILMKAGSQPILNWKPVKGSQANSADPDQMPHNVASDQVYIVC